LSEGGVLILAIFADTETRANLVIVFGLTNIHGSRWTNPKRRFTGSSGINTGW
jgi:hypothetical protein